MENAVQSTGIIETLYQKQMIKNLLERISFKNKGVLSPEELGIIEKKFLDFNIGYNQRVSELTTLHSYSGEQMKSYVSNKSVQPTLVEPVMIQEQPTLEKQKVLIKTPQKPFSFH